MADDEFHERPERIARQNPGAQVAQSREQSRRGFSVSYALGGLLWGIAVGSGTTYMNTHYDALFRGAGGPDVRAILAATGVFVSLLVAAVMLVAGGVYALVGRFGARRWSVLNGLWDRDRFWQLSNP